MLGAAGGVGVAACQIGKALGATVVAVVNGQDKLDFLRTLGVAHVIDASALSGPGSSGNKGLPLHIAIKAVAPKGA